MEALRDKGLRTAEKEFSPNNPRRDAVLWARLAVDSKALPSWASHPAHDSGVETGMPIMAKRTIGDNETITRFGPKSRGGLATNSI